MAQHDCIWSSITVTVGLVFQCIHLVLQKKEKKLNIAINLLFFSDLLIWIRIGKMVKLYLFHPIIPISYSSICVLFHRWCARWFWWIFVLLQGDNSTEETNLSENYLNLLRTAHLGLYSSKFFWHMLCLFFIWTLVTSMCMYIVCGTKSRVTNLHLKFCIISDYDYYELSVHLYLHCTSISLI